MTITVAPGVVNRIRREPEAIVVQVQQASDPEAAATALARAAEDIAGLGDDNAPGLAPGELFYPKWVSGVMRAGTGPFLMIDAVDTPRRLLATIPDVVVARLQEAGVTDATVATPRQGGPLTRMFYGKGTGLARAVSLVLYPRPPTIYERVHGYQHHIPDSWLVEEAAWVCQGLADNHELRAAIVAMEFPVRAGDALSMLRQSGSDNTLELVSGTLGRRIRRIRSSPSPAILSGGGPAASDAELVAITHALVDVARRLASDVAYAVVSVAPTFGGWASDWYLNGGENPQTVERLCDEYVFDAFAYQVLGPLHLARLGGPPPGAEPLAGGRVGVAVGDPADWLLAPPDNPYDPYANLGGRRRDPAVCDRGRRLLAPCLLRTGEGNPLHLARESRMRGDPPEGGSR